MRDCSGGYISRFENRHTVPSIATLEEVARALEVPTYELFYYGKKPPDLPRLMVKQESACGVTGQPARYLNKI